MGPKGNSIELSTFLKYGLTEVIGHKTLVNYVWCKVFAKFKNQIESSSNVRGSAKTSVLAFINGTNSVTKRMNLFYYLYMFSV